jgi:hypothetical protein
MKEKILLVVFIVSVSIAGCIRSQPPPADSLSDDSSQTSPADVDIAPLKATSTVTNIPSPTALPVLSPEQAQATILEWLDNNGDCQLPCVWTL